MGTAVGKMNLPFSGNVKIDKRFRLFGRRKKGRSMARYAGRGRATVESCRSIDVLEWYRRGYLRSPRWFSWAWTQDGERVASISVQTERRRGHAARYRSTPRHRSGGLVGRRACPRSGRHGGGGGAGHR